MAQKRLYKRELPLSEDELRSVQLIEYDITTEPIMDRQYRKLPRHVKDAFERLHYEAQSQPREAIPKLIEWIKKYPNIPQLYNYLSVAYSATGQRVEMEAAILENYRRNPDYVFARLNYAELLLDRGDYDQVAEVLEHKFDLKLLYPKRTKFHVTEVVGFMGVVGLYFIGVGKRDAAMMYYDVLKQIGQDYPATQRLRCKLYPGILRRLFLRLIGRL